MYMETTEINYYSVLGVSANAETSEIKKRYRALSKSYHPDTPGGDSAKMVLLNEAYSVLSDPVKRHFYEPPVPKRAHTAVKQPVRSTYAYGGQSAASRPVRSAPQKEYYEKEEPKSTWAQILSYVLAVPVALIIFAFVYPHLQQFLPKTPEVTAWPQTATESTTINTIEAPTTVNSQPVDPVPVQQPSAVTSNNNTTITPPTITTPVSPTTTTSKFNHSIRYRYYTNQ